MNLRRLRPSPAMAVALLALIVALLVYTAVVAAMLIVARVGYDWSIDGVIDRIASSLSGR